MGPAYRRARVHLLYIDHFGSNELTQLHIRPDQHPSVYNNPVGMV